jgi:hypothetical protein
MNQAGDAFADCTRCVEIDPKYTKGFIRRAQVTGITFSILTRATLLMCCVQAGVELGDVEHIQGAIRDYEAARK